MSHGANCVAQHVFTVDAFILSTRVRQCSSCCDSFTVRHTCKSFVLWESRYELRCPTRVHKWIHSFTVHVLGDAVRAVTQSRCVTRVNHVSCGSHGTNCVAQQACLQWVHLSTACVSGNAVRAVTPTGHMIYTCDAV